MAHQSRRCRAHRTNGQPCRAWAVHGALICIAHGAAAGHVRAAATRRYAAERAEALAVRMLGRSGDDRTPAEHLLDELYRSAALVEVYAGLVAKLDRREAGIDRADWPVQADGFLVAVRGPRGALHADVHPFVTLYHQASERRARFAKLAIQAGVAEATVRLAERTSGIIVAAFQAALADPELNLDEAQQQTGRAVAARHLRELEQTT